MAQREVKTFIYSCDWCGTEFRRTSEDENPLKSVYYKVRGGYGDMQLLLQSDELCDICYESAPSLGYSYLPREAKELPQEG